MVDDAVLMLSVLLMNDLFLIASAASLLSQVPGQRFPSRPYFHQSSPIIKKYFYDSIKKYDFQMRNKCKFQRLVICTVLSLLNILNF
mmetsp:Transcript_15938/g.43149  ORF Transcript_15938/g.43149 Transcript_15938/m.43149 type:complete len:87 (-) Transcript_15938:235-495(-)